MALLLETSARGLLLAALGAPLLACQSSSASSGAPDASVPLADAGADSGGEAATPQATSCTLAAPTPPDWRLHADGTSFKDGLGRVVMLRGVNAGGRSKFAPYVPFDYDAGAGGYDAALAAYMDHAARWGIDVMRVPFTWAALEPTQGANDADWLSRYDRLLDAAWARGIWTILDFHQDVYSEVFCGDGFPGWTVPDAGPPHHDCPGWVSLYNDPGVEAAFDHFWAAGSPVQAAYLAAWDVMVARYKDRPGVLGFEPINEPGWGTAPDEGAFTATTLTAFYSSMVPHMRQAAPSSLVFVDPPGLDGAFESTKLGKPAGDGIVFAPHFYPVSGPNGDIQAGLQAWATVGTTWNVPVFVGEFGGPDQTASNTDYMSQVFDGFDALGLSGSEWEYSVESEAWDGEQDSIVTADGGELPITSAVQRPFARAVAGTAITQAFDTTANVFTLAYTPATGITDVSLPRAPYPSGYAVSLTGGCVDSTTVPGRLLLQADPGVTQVSLKIQPK